MLASETAIFTGGGLVCAAHPEIMALRVKATGVGYHGVSSACGKNSVTNRQPLVSKRIGSPIHTLQRPQTNNRRSQPARRSANMLTKRLAAGRGRR